MSMEFSRQEYWCGGPFLSPGNLPNLGIKPWFPTLQADSLLSEPPLVSLGFSKKKNNLQSLHFKIKMSTKVALKTVLIGLLEDFSGGPVVKTSSCQWREHEFHPRLKLFHIAHTQKMYFHMIRAIFFKFTHANIKNTYKTRVDLILTWWLTSYYIGTVSLGSQTTFQLTVASQDGPLTPAAYSNPL